MNRTTGVAIVTVALIAAGSGGAAAARFITSEDIKNDTIQSEDVRDGALKPRDLNEKVNGLLRQDRRGISDVWTQSSMIQFNPPETTWTANCGAGAIALSAGFRPIQEGQIEGQPYAAYNQPVESAVSRWQLTLRGNAGYDVEVWARCAILD
jgi:hypothetical protein